MEEVEIVNSFNYRYYFSVFVIMSREEFNLFIKKANITLGTWVSLIFTIDYLNFKCVNLLLEYFLFLKLTTWCLPFLQLTMDLSQLL